MSSRRILSFIISIVLVFAALPIQASADGAEKSISSVKITSLPNYWSNRFIEDYNDYSDGKYYVSISGLEVLVSYNDGTSKTVKYFDEMNNFKVIDGQDTEKWGVGVHPCSIEYCGVVSENQFDVTVVKNPIQSLEIVSVPDMDFYAGMVYLGYGTVVKINYTDGSEPKLFTASKDNVVTYSYSYSESNEFNVGDSSESAKMIIMSGGSYWNGESVLKAGENELTVSYYGRTASTTINAVSLADSIEVVTPPTAYNDLSGTVLKTVSAEKGEKVFEIGNGITYNFVDRRNGSSSGYLKAFNTNEGLLNIGCSYNVYDKDNNRHIFEIRDYSVKAFGCTAAVNDLDIIRLSYMADAARICFGFDDFEYTGSVTADNIDKLADFVRGPSYYGGSIKGSVIADLFKDVLGKDVDLTLSSHYDASGDLYGGFESHYSFDTLDKFKFTETEEGYTAVYDSIMIKTDKNLKVTYIKVLNDPKLSITKLPTRTVYYSGEKRLNLQDIQLIYRKANGEKQRMSSYNLTYEIDDPTWSIGKHAVTINHNGAKTAFEIEIVENPIERVSLTKLPDDVEFVEEDDYDTFFQKYYISLWGAEFDVFYKDGSEKHIIYEDLDYNERENIVVEDGQDKEKWTVGTHKCTFSYYGVSDSFYATVKPNPVESIEILEMPEFELFVGHSYDGEGSVIRINYNDGRPSKTVTLKYVSDAGAGLVMFVDGQIMRAGTGTLIKGENDFVVHYMGREAHKTLTAERTFDVESVSILKAPKDYYHINDTLLEVTLKDGTKTQVEIYKENFDLWGGTSMAGFALTSVGGVSVSKWITYVNAKITKMELEIFGCKASTEDVDLMNISNLASRVYDNLFLSYKSFDFDGRVTKDNIDLLASVLHYVDASVHEDGQAYGTNLKKRFNSVFGVTPDLALSSRYNASADIYQYIQKPPRTSGPEAVEEPVLKVTEENGKYRVMYDRLEMVISNDFVIECFTLHPEEGDINGDKSVNIIDLAMLKKRLASNDVEKKGDGDKADVNGDGKINSADLIMLKKILLRVE